MATGVTNAEAGRGFGPGRGKIEALLSEPDRLAYAALLARPETTGADALTWLRGRGYDVGSSAMWRHLRAFRRRLQELHETAELAAGAADLAAAHGAAWLSDLVVLQMERAAFRRLGRDRELRGLSPKEFVALAKAVAATVASRRALLDAGVGAVGVTNGTRAASVTSPAAAGRAVAARVAELLGLPPIGGTTHDAGPSHLPGEAGGGDRRGGDRGTDRGGDAAGL
jgi:hypothetical protein